jgi:hypothetical protein
LAETSICGHEELILAKMTPPRVSWAEFGSKKMYTRSYARNLKMARGPPTRLT